MITLKYEKKFSIVSNMWMHFITLKYMDALHCFYFYLINYINIIIFFFSIRNICEDSIDSGIEVFVVVVVVVKYVTFAKSVRKRFNNTLS